MAADVSSLVRVLNRYKEDQHHRTIGNEDESTAPITRDLLGGSFKLPESQELDLDLQVPNGYEKRLDLKSGKVYIQRCNTPNSSPSSLENNNNNKNQTLHKLQDLNNPPLPSKKSPLNLFDETSLDLKLVSSSSPSQPSSCHYQSVCTLDKVKFALERAEKEPFIKKRTSLWKSSTSPSYSSSSSSIKETLEDHNTLSLSPVAAGCPGCLLYVLISKNNPKCPRCNSVVPFPKTKKPRIDLNISI